MGTGRASGRRPASLDSLLGGAAAAPADPQDASAALAALGSASRAPGLLFVPPGNVQVRRSADLNKPLVLPKGAVLDVASGATLSLNQPLNAGPWQVFSGAGAVKFKPGTALRILPEWFGAKGDGSADDADAIDRAIAAADDGGADVLFSAGQTYGIGHTIVKRLGMRIYSEDGATFKALQPGLVGMFYDTGGSHARPDVLPAFLGFATAVEFGDNGMVDSYTPLIAPAPGLPCKEGLRINADSCRIKFGTIRGCETGVHVTTRTPVRTVMQGLTVEGEQFVDTSGVAKQVFLFTALKPDDPPKWDHGLYSLRSVKPHPEADGFAVVRSNLPPEGDKGLPFHTYEIGALGALPRGGRLLDTPIWNSVLRVAPAAPFADGALDYSGGDFNSIYFTGAAAQYNGPTLTLSSSAGSLAAFKSANGLALTPWQNVLTVAIPADNWQAGEQKQFYMYHQLAYEGQLVFLTVPGWGSRCIDGKLAVTALTDNSYSTDKVTGGVKYEVVLQVVACRAFSGALTFPVAVGAAST
ncbi:hypothetical protein ABPG75_007130 [Micractinium tetrahymenae]